MYSLCECIDMNTYIHTCLHTLDICFDIYLKFDTI